MDFRVLGPLEVESGQGPVPIKGAKERALLALLLFRANRPVSRDLLIDELWGAHPPATARHTLEAYVSRLRRALAAGGNGSLLESQPGGYRICVEADQLDALRFERLLAEGRSALASGAPEQAEEKLQAALALWRGPVLADLAYEPFAEAEAQRLEELRLAGVEARLEAALQLGRDAELVGELQTLVATHPLRERLRAQLMLALYRSGRQADALATYRDGRNRLVDELGIEPGRELQQLEQAILRHEQALERPTKAPAAPVAEPRVTAAPSAATERRKVVTVLFCDVTGSTALGEQLDPETLQTLLARYFERMKAIVEFHGGTVEKFIGDAVMAVFGVPAVHEDDALRACRAALEMRSALPELGIQGRIGVNSGEVVTGTYERLATGDAVNVAARLEQVAPPGEVLIGEQTLALVHGLVEAEPVEPLRLVGKWEPVAAYRLLGISTAPELRPEPPFVGREPELSRLQESWERARAERRCELVTIVGEAGVGKSRFVSEVLASLDARVVRGRCLPYGKGITYWPVVDIVKQLDALPSDPAAAAALSALLGESEVGTSAEEIAWAFRKLLEEHAPLVVVFDDIHSGEETLLNLIEHVALLSTGAPLLLLCMARPELCERRPAWPVALHLKPLDDEDVSRLIGDRIPAELRDRVVHAAGGNPLFVVELLAMAGQTAEIDVPPTLRALIAARLDQLDGPERHVLEGAAVEGEIFHRGAVHALTPDEPELTHRLAGLVHRELVRPEQAQIPGEDGFRFRHLLIRDAAYDALPKSVRAELHERFAGWLEQHGHTLVELDEILGYHLERAVRYREELGLSERAELRATAKRRLQAAGRRAYLTQDHTAAAGLLERAAALLPAGEADLGLEFDLGEALYSVDPQQALQRARALAEQAADAGDRIGELFGRIQESIWSIWVEPEGAFDRLAALTEEALPVFESARDEVALCLAHSALAFVASTRGAFDTAVEAFERAAAEAARAGLADRFVHWRSLERMVGTTPASQFLAWEEKLDARDRREWQVRQDRAYATAMLGRIDEARAQLAELRAELAERGSTFVLGAVSGEAGAWIELLAGDPAAAAALAETGAEESALPTLADAYYQLGRLEDAEVCAVRAAELAASDDWSAQMPVLQVRAKVLARRGDHAEAERLAREAVATGAKAAQALRSTADAYADLAEVLSLAGRTSEAAEALEQALDRYERKENLVMAERTRARLGALREGAPT